MLNNWKHVSSKDEISETVYMNECFYWSAKSFKWKWPLKVNSWVLSRCFQHGLKRENIEIDVLIQAGNQLFNTIIDLVYKKSYRLTELNSTQVGYAKFIF